MKYVVRDHEGMVSWDEYFQYIESLKGQIPEDIYEYAASWEHYSLDSRSSLHDAWLEDVCIKESLDENQERNIAITVIFLGPFHDRKLVFEYRNITSYSLVKETGGNGHGDVNLHEIRYSAPNISHEILFQGGSVMLIECMDLLYTEEPVQGS